MRSGRVKGLRLIAAAAGGFAAIMSPAPGVAAPAGDDSVDAVFVTAQRRPERPEEVPISLTVASGGDLDRLQATDMISLGKVAPSLVMMRSGAFMQPVIRGVGKRSNLGVENNVATYLDGVYLASSISALLDLRGVDRVEILNGPQGTLFGRNTTGGVIQVITREPSAKGSGEVEAHGGVYGYLRGDAYLTGGGSRLAGDLAVSLSRNGGYGTNIFDGDADQGEISHSLVARSKWVWRPSDGSSFTLAADYQDISQDISMRPLSGFPPPIGAPRVQDFRDGDQDASNTHHYRYGGASIRADAQVAGLSFMSLSAVRQMNAHYSLDLDQGPAALFSASPIAKQTQFSQEFQVRSNDASRVSWTGGVYYIGLREQFAPLSFHYGGDYSASLGGRISQTLADVGRVSSYAAYGQAVVPLGEATRLTAGLRYTWEHRSVQARGERRFETAPFVRPIPGLPLLADPPLRAGKSFDEATWRLSLDRTISPVLMGYVSAGRGFQSGGWNLQAPQAPAFDPERIDDFEGGLKYVSRSGRFRADAAVFLYDYSDLQVSAFTPLGAMTTNATSANVYGGELQIDARLSEWTDVRAGLQVLRARYDRFENATCTDYGAGAAAPYATAQCDATGNRLPFAPKAKFNLGASHRIPLGAGLVELSSVVAYSSSYYSEPDNVVRQKAFTTVDASAGWRSTRGELSVRLWATNLTNCRHYESLATFPTAGVFQKPAAPRRFGVSVARRF